MLLVQGTPDARQSVPDDALQVFAKLSWRVPVDELRGQRLLITTSRQWVSHGASNSEMADGVVARIDDDVIASALLVSRTATGIPGPAFGERALPPTPQVGSEHPFGDLVVERSRVTAFATTTGITHPLHLDTDHCRQSGFDDLVVQGLELVDDVTRASGLSAGSVSTWFRKAIVAGERATLASADDVWVVRTAMGEIAAIAFADPDTDSVPSRIEPVS